MWTNNCIRIIYFYYCYIEFLCINAFELHLNKFLDFFLTEELSKVDVEEVAGLLDHDVIVVAVADPQDVGHDAVPGAGSCGDKNRLRK